MFFACLNIEPITATELPKLLHHNFGDRSKLLNVDNSRTTLNECSGIFEKDENGQNHFYDKIKNLLPNKSKQNRKIRADAKIAISFVFQVSPGWQGDQEKFFEESTSWVNKKFKGDIVATAIHRDEKTDHMHLIFVPKDTEGRANFREQFSGTIPESREKFKKMQTSFYDHCGRPFGLARGKSREQRQEDGTSRFYGAGSAQEREIRLDYLSDIEHWKNQSKLWKNKYENLRHLKTELASPAPETSDTRKESDPMQNSGNTR